MRGLLLATHGGASADGAVRVANELTRTLGTTLRVLGVLELVPIVDGGFNVPYLEPPEAEEALREALRAAIAEQLARCGVEAKIQVTTGSPAQEIAASARVEESKLIVLGIGSHRLLDRALGHETALQLVQTASTPVLAVAAGAMSTPRHVLVAVDFSPTSVIGARIIGGWMREGDVLHLVHVTPFGSNRAEDAADRMRVSGLRAKEIETLAAELGVREGVTVRTSVVAGEPAAAVLRIAEREGADLIATGSHGYGIWKRLTLGSVASEILRLSTKSVMVTPLGSLASLQLPEIRYASTTDPLSREEARIGVTL